MENLIVEPLHTEKDLLVRASQGDRYAFGHLFDRYNTLLYFSSYKYLKVHDLTEDVVQNSFLKIWEKRLNLVNVNRFDRYLVKVARNEVLDYFRKSRSHKMHQERIFEQSELQMASPEDVLIDKQKRDKIADVIKKLTPQQQQAYGLSRDEGMTYMEIASRMNLSVNTVKIHISLAIKSLKIYFIKEKNELCF